jgi:hypothetical protein
VTEQSVAADRLQLRSFLTSLPAAAELGRCAACVRLDLGVTEDKFKLKGMSKPVCSSFTLVVGMIMGGVAGVLNIAVLSQLLSISRPAAPGLRSYVFSPFELEYAELFIGLFLLSFVCATFITAFGLQAWLRQRRR